MESNLYILVIIFYFHMLGKIKGLLSYYLPFNYLLLYIKYFMEGQFPITSNLLLTCIGWQRQDYQYVSVSTGRENSVILSQQWVSQRETKY